MGEMGKWEVLVKEDEVVVLEFWRLNVYHDDTVNNTALREGDKP